jgi:hypothetical protein
MMDPFQPVTAVVADQEIALRSPIYIGVLAQPLAQANPAILDRESEFIIDAMGVQLDSVDLSSLLSGANRFAIEIDGDWEIIGAQKLELVGPQRYRCGTLLRGLEGTDGVMAHISAGARVLWLGQGLADVQSAGLEIGESVEISASSGGRTAETLRHSYTGAELRPFAPAHMRVSRDAGEIVLSFIPRAVAQRKWSGTDAVDPTARYRVQWWNGDALVLTEIVVGSDITRPDIATATHVSVAAEHSDYGWGSARRAEIR